MYDILTLILGTILLVIAYHGIRNMIEGFDNPSTKPIPPCPPDYVHCGSGDCRLKTDIYNPCP
jgi:hypothetical protein